MLSPTKHPIYAASVLLGDILAIAASFLLAYWVRFSGFVIPTHKGVPDFSNYWQVALLAIPVYVAIFHSYRLYEPGRHIRRIQELLLVVKAVTIAAVILMALTFVYREFSFSRVTFLFAWVFSIIFCVTIRYLLIQIEYWIRKEKDRYRVLLVGVNRSARDIIRWAKTNRHYGQDIAGVLTHQAEEEGKHFEGVPILGPIKAFDAVLAKTPVDEVILTDCTLSREMATEMMVKCENKMVGFKLVADFYGLITHYVDVEYVSNVPLLGLKTLPLDDFWNRCLKRGFDSLVSLATFVFLLPLFTVVAAIIKLSDGGPIFYSQERVGRDGQAFRLHKFRTMQVNAEKATGPVWAKMDDQRVTALGRWLRRTNLDELPQLWNVLAGEMSLVGPRPERPHFVEQFRDQIPRYMARHKIKSGITGWAQIHGLRGNTSLEERIKYDLYYMENWTLMMDIEILLVTPFAFRNAY